MALPHVLVYLCTQAKTAWKCPRTFTNEVQLDLSGKSSLGHFPRENALRFVGKNALTYLGRSRTKVVALCRFGLEQYKQFFALKLQGNDPVGLVGKSALGPVGEKWPKKSRRKVRLDIWVDCNRSKTSLKNQKQSIYMLRIEMAHFRFVQKWC